MKRTVKTSNTDLTCLPNCESCHWQANKLRLSLNTSYLGSFDHLYEKACTLDACDVLFVFPPPFFCCCLVVQHDLHHCNEFVGRRGFNLSCIICRYLKHTQIGTCVLFLYHSSSGRALNHLPFQGVHLSKFWWSTSPSNKPGGYHVFGCLEYVFVFS